MRKEPAASASHLNFPSWLDYASIHEAADRGALNLKQDVRLVNEITTVESNWFLELVKEGHFTEGQQVLCVVPESGRFSDLYYDVGPA
ncbi:hypothetical protein ACFQZR_23870 [Paenibacillus sp. GCM10027629]|uniref:hypothetical protein n=1 Tax=Paenibacillus sp. GCM10027629 TaxID=3273414 RepID=UPI003630346D